jgi:hypothetical protein
MLWRFISHANIDVMVATYLVMPRLERLKTCSVTQSVKRFYAFAEGRS